MRKFPIHTPFIYRNHGFSLIEMVIATGIFAIITLMTFGIFSYSLRGQQQALVQSRVDREAQLILETIAKKIRFSHVDYAAYPDESVPEAPDSIDYLLLRDQVGSTFNFQLNNKAINLKVDANPTRAITASNVQVTDLDFFISPATDPFIPGTPPETQPRVTVVISFLSNLGESQSEVIVQQTIPQRGGGY